MPRPPAKPATAKRSPRETTAIGLGSVSIVLLALTVGVSFFVSIVMSSFALWLGRRTGRRAAIVVAVIGLVLGAVAAITWSILVGQGITPQDLQDSLQRSLDHARAH
jgi:MFS family permease